MFGKNIKKYRTEQRYSQKQLAEMIGTSQAAIFHYETETADPRLSTLERIAKALNVTVIDLLREG